MTGLEILGAAAVGAVVEAGAKSLFEVFTRTTGFRQAYAHTRTSQIPQPQVTGM